MDIQSVLSNKGIPGLDASKGERIIEAFKKLQKKFEHNTNKSLKDKRGLTLTDVQLRLLIIQLKFIRKILRDKITSPESEIYVPESFILSLDHTKDNDDEFRYNSEEKQTEISLPGCYIKENKSLDNNSDFSTDKNVEKCITEENSTDASQKIETVSKISAPQTQKSSTLSFKQHYHFKFSDLPFILGTSYDSKNRFANYQEIAAMLKNHHPMLCQPQEKFQTQNCTTTTSLRVSSCDRNIKAEEPKRETPLPFGKNARSNTLNAKFNHDSGSKGAKCEKSKSAKSFKKQILVNSKSTSMPDVHQKNKTEKHAVPTNLTLNNLPQVSRYRNFLAIQELKRSISQDNL